jgi:hypothetical protein
MLLLERFALKLSDECTRNCDPNESNVAATLHEVPYYDFHSYGSYIRKIIYYISTLE